MLAYIDATTGGMTLQLLLGGLAGSLVILKLTASSFLDVVLHRKRSVVLDEDAGRDEDEQSAA